MKKTISIAIGGAFATAIAFGPARMGYGLFLPSFREAFSLSTSHAGLIASGAFAAFFIALLVSAYLVMRFGPRIPVVWGALAAATGMGIVAGTPDKAFFSCGIVLAATSAGLCWSPFNNAVGRAIAITQRGRVLSIVSTGTTIGIAGAGICALAVATLSWDWRSIWFCFSGLALVCALFNTGILNKLPEAPSFSPVDFEALKRLLENKIIPIYCIAVSFGITNGIYLSFAVDRVVSAGGLASLQPGGSGGILFISFGVGGIFGLFTADFERRIGLRWLVRLIFLCSTVSLLLLTVWANTWLGVIGSAALQGLCLMGLSAIFSFVSQRLYPDMPSVSFTAVLAVYAFGNVVGPALSGYLASASNLLIVFTGAAILSFATSLLFRPQNTSESV